MPAKKKPAPIAPAAAAKPLHYILVARDTSYCLIGPFRRAYDAARWGRSPKNNLTDDPRWQTIQLASPRGAPVIINPASGPMPA